MPLRLKPVLSALVVAGAVILLSVSFVYSRGANFKQHNAVMDRLRQLKQLDATLNQDLLKLRFGLLMHYDSIPHHVEHLRALIGGLKEGSAAIYGKTEAAIDEQVLGLERLLARKEAVIEQFPAENATLNNSLRYFPTLTTQLLKSVKDLPLPSARSLEPVLNELLSRVLVYNLTASEELKPQIQVLLDALTQASGELPPEMKEDLTLMTVHAKTILTEKQLVDQLLSELLSMPMAEQIDSLEAGYTAFYATADRRAGRYRLVLYVLCMAFLAALVYIMLRLSMASKALVQANATLEQRVRERTEALSATNDQLAKEIDQRKRDQETLAEYSKRIEQSNRELDDFTYIVSHDLKEPLRSIDAFSKFVVDDYADKLGEEGMGYLERVRANAKRMQQLIEDLLAVSRLSRSPNEFQVVKIQDLIEEVKLRFEYVLSQGKVQILVKNSLPTLTCDRVRITEVFANLISNAIKYNDKPQCRIEISSQESDPGGHQFSIRDNGRGIEPQFFEKIFQIFQRLGKKEEQEGTGVGLTIVKKVVELHKGKIWVESTPGEGTTFHFTIPLTHNKTLPKD